MNRDPNTVPVLSLADQVADEIEKCADEIHGIYSCIPGREHWWAHETLIAVVAVLRADSELWREKFGDHRKKAG